MTGDYCGDFHIDFHFDREPFDQGCMHANFQGIYWRISKLQGYWYIGRGVIRWSHGRREAPPYK